MREEREPAEMPVFPVLLAVRVISGVAGRPADGDQQIGMRIRLRLRLAAEQFDRFFVEFNPQAGTVGNNRQSVFDRSSVLMQSRSNN